jgi:hypothetical protein
VYFQSDGIATYSRISEHAMLVQATTFAYEQLDGINTRERVIQLTVCIFFIEREKAIFSCPRLMSLIAFAVRDTTQSTMAALAISRL